MVEIMCRCCCMAHVQKMMTCTLDSWYIILCIQWIVKKNISRCRWIISIIFSSMNRCIWIILNTVASLSALPVLWLSTSLSWLLTQSKTTLTITSRAHLVLLSINERIIWIRISCSSIRIIKCRSFEKHALFGTGPNWSLFLSLAIFTCCVSIGSSCLLKPHYLARQLILCHFKTLRQLNDPWDSWLQDWMLRCWWHCYNYTISLIN